VNTQLVSSRSTCILLYHEKYQLFIQLLTRKRDSKGRVKGRSNNTNRTVAHAGVQDIYKRDYIIVINKDTIHKGLDESTILYK
jgi:hypothetical protein